MFGNSQTASGKKMGEGSRQIIPPTFLYFLSRAGNLLLVSQTTGISNAQAAVFSMQDAITVFH